MNTTRDDQFSRGIDGSLDESRETTRIDEQRIGEP